VAKRFLDVFEGDDPIVVPSGSCGAMVRNYYKDLFRDEPELLERAAAIASRTYEFTEFLVKVLGVDELPGGGRLTATATYHQCCHLLRELGVDEEPKALLERVDGLAMQEMVQSEVCCGFGGTFAVKFPDVSTGMLNDKLDHAKATGAEMLVAGDTGCILHMNGGLRRRGDAMKAVHLAEVLDQAGVGTDSPRGVPSDG
jgi:L-lactate dehydrogenase complex protein LldE